ncbi:hypothetical protein [Nocardiopsis sp. CC223A]|uniref:hypothetical protein n=1 Tax=Nocardiopsis sp. CC223A TaxID=3044051 RepID=UPI00278C6016|nr:hypothetical protein [Nocardiopsis sp. CC223A]
METEIVFADAREEVVRRLEETERLLGLEALPVMTVPYRDLVPAATAAVSRSAGNEGSLFGGA